MVTLNLKIIITIPKILNTLSLFFPINNDKNLEKNLLLQYFFILDKDHKTFDNPIQKEKLKKIMQSMRYEVFSILSP